MQYLLDPIRSFVEYKFVDKKRIWRVVSQSRYDDLVRPLHIVHKALIAYPIMHEIENQ